MNTLFSPFGAILYSRTLRRAYPTAPNARKISGVGTVPNDSTYGDFPPSVDVVAYLLATSHVNSTT